MLLTALRLADFRNYPVLDFAPAPGLNVFAGPNAQGKSNLLEAIAMLATGKSFRARREVELIRDGTQLAEIAGEARIPAGEIFLRASIERRGSGARKSFDVNGSPVGFARFLGLARVFGSRRRGRQARGQSGGRERGDNLAAGHWHGDFPFPGRRDQVC